jgi:hypothetical protein
MEKGLEQETPRELPHDVRFCVETLLPLHVNSDLAQELTHHVATIV